MASFILIANEGTDDHVAYEADTDEQIAAAKAALVEAGEESAPVYVGDPEGDHYRNGQVLWAR